MSTPSFAVGDRVRIADSYRWAQGASGTVEPFPAPQATIDGVFREVPARERVITFAWIGFDEPQTDGEGESGYMEAEIDVRYLLPAKA